MRWARLAAVAVLPVGIGVLAGWQITRHTMQPTPPAVAAAPHTVRPAPPPQQPAAPPAIIPEPNLPVPPVLPAPATPIAFAPPSVPPLPPQPTGLVPAPPGPPVLVPPAPALTPLPAAPGGAAVTYVNAPRVAVDYEVTRKGASGLGTMELWLKDAAGWSRVTTAQSNQRLEADLPADGVYGAKVVPVSGQGVRGPEPAGDAAPDLWVVRDTTPPHMSLEVAPKAKAIQPGPAPFVIVLTVTDTNLDPDTLVFDGAGVEARTARLFTAKELDLERIETKLGVFIPRKDNSLPPNPAALKVVLDWTPAADAPPRVNFAIAVKDRAGNAISACQTNVGTDLTQPDARVTGVRGLPGR